MGPNVLIADSEEAARTSCARVLKALGFETRVAESGPSALAILESHQVDIVLADASLSGGKGADWAKIVKQKYPGIDIVLMTKTTAVASASAYDGYVREPFQVSEVKHLLDRLAQKQELTRENRLLHEQLKTQRGFGSLIGTSSTMQDVYSRILKVALRRHPVLILGESGTGKELVARAIHAYSQWHDRPFVPVDCGALSATLIESELFGHVRGAFTGAIAARKGLLAAAEGGTIFLDEIAELPVELQAKLLRVLQEREIKPIGSDVRLRFEGRVIAATNHDLGAAMKRGDFRKDLYFRLNVVSIKLAPLRERKHDLPALVHYFIDRHGGAESCITGVSDEAMTRLLRYDWPGNVRELENCIQRALALGSPPLIQVSDLPSPVLSRSGDAAASQGTVTLRELERRAILQALETTGGDRLRAAKLLGIGRTTIYRKLKEYGLENPRNS